MELTKFLAFLAITLPVAYGAPSPTKLHPEILAALKRDLGLDARQATARVAREQWAAGVIEQLRTETKDSFAGAWIVDGHTLKVGVTSQAMAKKVSAAGATPVIMTNSLSKLTDAKKTLDKMGSQVRSAGTGIAAYYVDVASNKLVIEALSGSATHAKAMAKVAGLAENDEFEVRVVDKMPTTFATVQGGDAYYINQSARCSVGFSVTSGFVSAGHCGTSGSSAATSDGEFLGTFQASVFPGDADMSYIGTDGATLTGQINGYGSSSIPVTGSDVAASGSSICRSGSTTGVHCGTIRSFDATVNYSEGSVTGLTETDVCAEPGDSGGSFYSGSQAQGVTSGGSGDCSSGGITYFQPVNEILETYGLTLVTS
ncbi:peptidase alpha-lytic pro domain protein [Xylaria bambusicola]|uniref:peptidase alpha-lytic pro domain protein n=1 Tax=Xylaria bambusicola TaxID=326684 RepID=UPI0020081C40|nr:peptidase alpha-lytic pro domain protein [Xylaria bambusicola]KAI0506881.1 peptidase alpha-lytic pro domain protein [Xylaria bambusicola]